MDKGKEKKRGGKWRLRNAQIVGYLGARYEFPLDVLCNDHSWFFPSERTQVPHEEHCGGVLHDLTRCPRQAVSQFVDRPARYYNYHMSLCQQCAKPFVLLAGAREDDRENADIIAGTTPFELRCAESVGSLFD